jgi:16S rRNA (guanine1207-N2)-methyltransferase
MQRRTDDAPGPESDLRVPIAEQLLIDFEVEALPARVLCTSLGRGQLAADCARRGPAASVVCHFIDLYPAEEARELYGAGERNLAVECLADPPEGPFELAAVPVSRFGEAELARDLLQAAYERLVDGGRLLAAVDNTRDTWLHEELGKLFAKVTRWRKRRGVVYSAVRKGPLKRRRDFCCEFAFRDQGRLIRAVSRPGVFSHRQLDLGARALIEAMEVRAGDKVLDMGCGSGVVGLAAALRAENVRVHAIDSNARAVECAAQGAAINGLTAFTTQLDAHGDVTEPGTFDLVVGNPPYYSHYQIAEIFLQAARRALQPGGRVLIVTKKDEWHVARMGQLFAAVESREVRGYRVVVATQR